LVFYFIVKEWTEIIEPASDSFHIDYSTTTST